MPLGINEHFALPSTLTTTKKERIPTKSLLLASGRKHGEVTQQKIHYRLHPADDCNAKIGTYAYKTGLVITCMSRNK